MAAPDCFASLAMTDSAIHSFATMSFRSAFGRAPKCEITSAAAIAPMRRLSSRLRPRALADQEARREQVAGAGRVDHAGAEPRDRARDTRSPLSTAIAPSSPQVTTSKRHLVLDRGDRRVAVVRVRERHDLVLVGEEQVDRAGFQHRQHLGAGAA